jgi:ribosomal protein L11 methyltransferase
LFELLLRCSQDDAEALTDALMDELEALSASVEDADADTDAEDALFGEPGMPAPRAGWQRSFVKALFPTEAGAALAAQALSDHEWAGEVRVEAISEIIDQDWVRLTQAQFQPVAITPTFWIVPSWHDTPADAQQVIRLDPGMAFGTGTHPTTRMCLRWIARHANEGRAQWTRVLDYGCGSGILAIGAALHGAVRIDAVDIDPAAVQATRDNALANAVELRCGPVELAQGRYALVLANILATPLRMLAPLLTSHLAPGGSLVLAGILDRQADELIEAYAPAVRLGVTDCEDGWILMTARLGDTQRMA